MDFLFYKDFKNRLLSDNKFTIDLCEDQITRYGVDYLVAWRPSTTCILNESSGILLSGRVKYKTENILESVSSLSDAIISGSWPLNDDFTGMFSGLTFNDNILCIFNDPIGLFHIYYCITSEYVAVSTNLTSIQKITKQILKLGSVLMEIMGPEFSQYGKSTVLKDVFTLLPGELLRIGRKGVTSLYDTTIKKEDKIGNKNLANEFVNLINSEFHDFYNDEKPLFVSLSGGIDSRINLAACISNNKRPALSNYGTPDSIDSLIPKRIADRFNLEIEVLDPVQFQFPAKSVLQLVIKETDSLYGNLWLAILENHKDNTRYSRMLLGDMCDILRSKGIRSFKTRKFRRGHYMRNFFTGDSLTLTRLTEKGKALYCAEQQAYLLKRVDNAQKYIGFTMNEKDLKEEVNADLNDLFSHLNRYSPQFIESYEELFGILTHGRRAMGKQLNMLKMCFNPEIPILNLKIVRQVLNYSPIVRYSDELTNKMFRHPGWSALGRFPTSQNPFIAYNSNYYAMLLGWFLRSSVDQKLLKMHVMSKGRLKRQRLVRSYDIHSTYAYPGARDNFRSYFEEGHIDSSILLKLFDDRLNRKSWPLYGMDLMPYVQANYYLKEFSK